jgi:hypothetical protein
MALPNFRANLQGNTGFAIRYLYQAVEEVIRSHYHLSMEATSVMYHDWVGVRYHGCFTSRVRDPFWAPSSRLRHSSGVLV